MHIIIKFIIIILFTSRTFILYHRHLDPVLNFSLASYRLDFLLEGALASLCIPHVRNVSDAGVGQDHCMVTSQPQAPGPPMVEVSSYFEIL